MEFHWDEAVVAVVRLGVLLRIDRIVGGAQRAELHCQRDATSPLIVRIRVAQVAIVII